MEQKQGFTARIEITQLNELFGRNDLIDKLSILANRGHCVSLIGLRRFGKTSILKCIENSIRSDQASKSYPLFVDFKEVGSIIKGTSNVYRYLISLLIVRLTKDKVLTGDFKCDSISITSSDDWIKIYESLCSISPVRVQSLFEEIIIFISNNLDKTVLLLLDEYEWLFKSSFDEPVGFMKLRKISSTKNNYGRFQFSFWIAGSITWDYLCSLTGSGELNVIDTSVYLGPIDYESFQNMWSNEIKKIEKPSDLLINSSEFAYKASGGIPYFGKLIGSFIESKNKYPNFQLLGSYFQEIYNSLTNEEKNILLELASSPKQLKNSAFLLELTEKGLIESTNNGYGLKSIFLADFIKSVILPSKSKPEIPESQKITDRITDLILNINNTHKNKRGDYIFEPVVDEAALVKDLRTPCYSLEIFKDFASSLYKVVFERTKQKVGGRDIVLKKLPKQFQRGNQFIDIVDIMRHSLGGGHLMDTFSNRKGQMTKSKMLNILTGCKNEPNLPEEFYSLQITVLRMFEAELIKINSMIRALK